MHFLKKNRFRFSIALRSFVSSTILPPPPQVHERERERERERENTLHSWTSPRVLCGLQHAVVDVVAVSMGLQRALEFSPVFLFAFQTIIDVGGCTWISAAVVDFSLLEIYFFKTFQDRAEFQSSTINQSTQRQRQPQLAEVDRKLLDECNASGCSLSLSHTHTSAHMEEER